MSTKEILKTTCPRDCYDACGIAVIKRDGQITKVLGDPDHPVARGGLCGKCALAYNGAWRDPSQRLTQPLKRSGPKGSGAFQAITWDQALGEIAARLQTIVAQHGGERVYSAHYTGTCSWIAGNFPQRFFNRLGATDVEPDTICNNAGHVALRYLLGSSANGFDPRSAKDAACIFVWGANPSASAPHAHRHWLKESPAKVVVIDPIRHPTAADADLHLQLRPGSDAALAFALLQVLRTEGKVDRAFLAQHALGWEEIEPQLAVCTPAWGEAQTGVPAAQIIEAAKLFGAGPALLWLGQGLQRQPLGGNAFRAAALLPIATGNIGRKGGGLYYLNGGAMRGLDGGLVEGAELRAKPSQSVSHMDLVPTLEKKAKAFFCWNMNVAASAPRQRALRKALARDELLTVTVDLFMTDTALVSDYVLPAASFLEFDDLVVPYFHLTIAAQQKVMEPLGDSLPNQEIFRRLSRAMGYQEAALYEEDATLLDRLLAPKGVTFAQLKTKGWQTAVEGTYIPFADHRFPTPSGKIEIASALAESEGAPRLPRPVIDPPTTANHLRLLSPASPWQMNASYGNDAKILERLGPASVVLHPSDAASHQVKDGDPVRLSNDTGSLTLTAVLDGALVTPGTCYAPKGRWGENVNALFDARRTDLGDSSAVHGVEVRVEALA